MTDELEQHPDDDQDLIDYEWPYWHLDFPGLSEQRAEAILALLDQNGISLGGTASNPKEQLIVSLDRTTAQWLLAAIAEDSSVVLNDSNDAMIVISPYEARQKVDLVRQDLEEFLSKGEPYECELGPLAPI